MEVKGNLARLLATENLVVEHRNVETAMFNVVDRVLTLPMWKRASSDVYDMLVGHEVGHALYTPQKFGHDYGVPQTYINVVEDARIEKLMKRKFPGLSRNFFVGYKELDEQDFFCIGGRDLESYTLIDRINLHFKIGAYSPMPFSVEEKELVDLVADAETFEDVVEATRRILAYTKEKEMEKVADIPDAEEMGNPSPMAQDGDSMTHEEMIEEAARRESADAEETGNEGTPTTGAGDLGGEFKSETDAAFTESAKDLTSKEYGETHYVEMPPLDIETFVVSNKTVMKDCEECYAEQSADSFNFADNDYLTYRKEAQKEVNYLVKEFEMKKSADQYARASTAKTGVLDTSKLHTFKWNEDLFKKINVVPDGKNHGLIFVLDWSGSMGGILRNTVKQLFNIAWFCKKCQIPFDVYAFTNNYWVDRNFNYRDELYETSHPHHETVEGYIEIQPNFRMLNMVSFDGKSGKNLEKQLRNFWRIVGGEVMYCGYRNPAGYSLSGTPLNEAAISLTAIIPDFLKRNKVQKTNVVILSDGEAQSISYNRKLHYGGEDKFGRRHIERDCVLRDRQTGRVYPAFDGGYYSSGDLTTSTFLNAVRHRFPDINLIGIRLLNGRALNTAMATGRCETPYEKVQKQWKKEKTAAVPEFNGYQMMYFMSANDLHDDDTGIDVPDDATKTQIKNAFKKSLVKKGVNKKMLSSFAIMVS